MICRQWRVCRIRKAVEMWWWNLLGVQAIHPLNCSFSDSTLLLLDEVQKAFRPTLARRRGHWSYRGDLGHVHLSSSTATPSHQSCGCSFAEPGVRFAPLARPHTRPLAPSPDGRSGGQQGQQHPTYRAKVDRLHARIDAMELIVVCLASLVCITGPPRPCQ